MGVTNFLAIASSVLVMGAWFILPGSARHAVAAEYEERPELEAAA